MRRRNIGASESASAYVLCICIANVLSLFLSLGLSKTNVIFDGMTLYSWIGYALMQVVFIATTAIYFSVRKLDIPYVTRIRRPRSVWQLFLTPFIAIATILIFLPLANAWTSFLDVIHFHGGGVAMPEYSNAGVYFLSLFLMAILPAFGEEFMLRGATFSGLSSRNVWFGVFISALLFSLMHANPLQTVHQFGLGVVLALVLVVTDSLWACVLVHFFNNFISITLTAYLPQVDALYVRLGYFNWLTGAASVLVGIFLLVTLLYIAYKSGGGHGKYSSTDGIDCGDFTLHAVDYTPYGKKTNAFVSWLRFLGSLFTKAGRKRITGVLTEQNRVEYYGKRQPFIGVWLALGIVTVYWVYSFISGLL